MAKLTSCLMQWQLPTHPAEPSFFLVRECVLVGLRAGVGPWFRGSPPQLGLPGHCLTGSVWPRTLYPQL